MANFSFPEPAGSTSTTEEFPCFSDFSTDPSTFPGNSKCLCPCCFFSLFHTLFLVVRSQNQHSFAPYPLFNHKQTVQACVFKHESFMSGSYTSMQQSKLGLVFIIIDFAGYFKQHHWKLLTLSPLSFSLPLEELVRAALDIVRL